MLMFASLAVLVVGSLATSQTTPSTAPAQEVALPKYGKAVRLRAGAEFLGEGRLYPSPTVHDFNGDGVFDIVVGDLRGHLTVALGQRVDGEMVFGEEAKLKGADGEILDFGNW